MAKRNNSKKRSSKRSNKHIPTNVELFQGMRSEQARAAIFRTGGGKHQDKRRSHKTAQSERAAWRAEAS